MKKKNTIEYQNKMLTSAEWSRQPKPKELGLSGDTIYSRFFNLGWSAEETLTMPKGKGGRCKNGMNRVKPSARVCKNQECRKVFFATVHAEHGLCPQCWRSQNWTEKSNAHYDFTTWFQERLEMSCAVWGV